MGLFCGGIVHSPVLYRFVLQIGFRFYKRIRNRFHINFTVVILRTVQINLLILTVTILYERSEQIRIPLFLEITQLVGYHTPSTPKCAGFIF